MKKLLFILFILISFSGCSYNQNINNQKSTSDISVISSMYSLNRSVKITNGLTSGTGVVYIEGKHVYIISALHVFKNIEYEKLEKEEKIGVIISLNRKINEYNFNNIIVDKIYYGSNKPLYVYSKAEIIDYNKSKDLALLKLEKSNKEFLSTGTAFENKNNIKPGMEVIHVGNQSARGLIVTSGIIAHHFRDRGYRYEGDFNISQGSSGGGVFNKYNGKLIGIAVSFDIRTRMANIVPSHVIIKFLRKNNLHN